MPRGAPARPGASGSAANAEAARRVRARAPGHRDPVPLNVPARKRYVLALLFTADRERVVLMRRTRPAWQAGRVNALGGKLHDGESPLAAARREVRQEAGVDVARWETFLVWDVPSYRMLAVRAFHGRAMEARTAEDQVVFLAPVDALPANVIDNLRWLVPLALDRDTAVPIRARSAAPGGSGLTEIDPSA